MYFLYNIKGCVLIIVSEIFDSIATYCNNNKRKTKNALCIKRPWLL